jgi:hypothetical protein
VKLSQDGVPFLAPLLSHILSCWARDFLSTHNLLLFVFIRYSPIGRLVLHFFFRNSIRIKKTQSPKKTVRDSYMLGLCGTDLLGKGALYKQLILYN